jgi:hypothetical protein
MLAKFLLCSAVTQAFKLRSSAQYLFDNGSNDQTDRPDHCYSCHSPLASRVVKWVSRCRMLEAFCSGVSIILTNLRNAVDQSIHLWLNALALHYLII